MNQRASYGLRVALGVAALSGCAQPLVQGPQAGSTFVVPLLAVQLAGDAADLPRVGVATPPPGVVLAPSTGTTPASPDAGEAVRPGVLPGASGASPAPGGGSSSGGSGGGGSGGGGTSAAATPGTDTIPLSLDAGPDPLTVDALGFGVVSLPADALGSIFLAAPGFVPSTIVVDRPDQGRIPLLHQRPQSGALGPRGVATLTGSLGLAGAELVLSYRSAGRTQQASGLADTTGAFSFEVPVSGVEDGLIIASGRSSDEPVAIARLRIEEGQTIPVTGLAPTSPAGWLAGPPPPSGLLPGASGLVVIEDGPQPVRIDMLGFPGTAVPRLAVPGITTAAAFYAERADGLAGASVLTAESGAPAFLSPPDLASLPDLLVPGAVLAWPAVAGASLYTLRLQAFGHALPLWEGATKSTRIVLPPDLPAELPDLELRVDAWAASDVTLYSVAGLRQLRLPDSPRRIGGRHSWALRRGLGT